MPDQELVHTVATALAREPRVELGPHPLLLRMEGHDLVLEGEVRDVAAKKLALERAASIPGVDRLIDRLHVLTHHHAPDEVILERVCEALRGESALQPFRLISRRLGPGEEPELREGQRGFIAVSVEDGVVTLDGNVTGLEHKRLAGVLAWWVVGVRDVVNGLGVEPPEEDSDLEISDAVRLVLEKDPSVEPDGIQVRTKERVVHLEGAVRSKDEARDAELDAWCIFGVDRVENGLQVVT